MNTVRTWLVSGTFAAAMGAGLLCGAGIAAADSGGDRSSGASADAATESPKADRGVRGAGTRPAGSPARISGAPVGPLASAISESLSRPTTLTAKVNRSAASTRAKIADAAEAAATPASAAGRRVVGGLSTAPVASLLEAPKSAAAMVSPPKPAAAIAAPVAAAQAVSAVPSSVPVDPAQFAGTYYEQGSVKQFFSIGLVNTKATYTLNPDGTIRVQNSGNYFFNRGPRSSIVGSAVVVNDTNTALNVGFSPFSKPSANPPGNYTILANAPDYSYVIVSDPTGRSGYILTRSKTISPQEYQQFLDQARSLGVKGRITVTKQYA